jgi:hypothetical protein
MISSEAFNGRVQKGEILDIFTRGYVVLITVLNVLYLIDIDKKISVIKGHKEFEKDGFNFCRHV